MSAALIVLLLGIAGMGAGLASVWLNANSPAQTCLPIPLLALGSCAFFMGLGGLLL